MSTDWAGLCAVEGFSIDGQLVTVRLDKGRHQKVTVCDEGDALLLAATVSRPASEREGREAANKAWQRNRSARMAGFRVDHRNRLIGEYRIPVAGVTPDEFQFTLRRFAAECDTFEFTLTGKDQE